MAMVNLVGTKAVLAAAHAAGCDPIVHVSSTLAVVPTDQDVIGPDTPPGNSDPELAPYSSSKSAQEAVARSMQDQGAPVVTVLPGSVWGPNDPYDGESVGMARAIARRQMPMTVRGGLGVVDVRDVADVIAAVVREGPGKGPRRYTAGGHSQTLSDLHRGIGAVLGKTLVTLPAPFGAAMLLARAARVLQRRVRTRLPISTEQVYVMRALRPIDDTRTVEDLGVTFRPIEATLRDQLGWMQAAGRL